MGNTNPERKISVLGDTGSGEGEKGEVIRGGGS